MVYTVRNHLFPSNTYLLTDSKEETCLVIDPGMDEEAVAAKIATLGLLPVAIIATHGHFDHIGGVQPLQEQYGIPYYLHEADLKLSQSANFYLKLSGIPKKIKTPTPDHLFKGKQDSVQIGPFYLEVYNYPGHSTGSIVIRVEDKLFTGDILYKKGLGFNNYPGENKAQLRESILAILEQFPDDAMVFPGHGEGDTLGNIKTKNTELQEFLSIKEVSNG